MSAWLNGECPPGDPTTVQQRLNDIAGWITADKSGADPDLLAILNSCETELARITGIPNYAVDNAAKLFSAWGKAKTASEKPPGDPTKTDEWRGTCDDLREVVD